MTDRIRASDAEREEYAKIIRAAMTEGRLTLEEGEERLAQTYAVKYRDELPALGADLPGGGRQALFDEPQARDERRRDSRRHLSRHAGALIVLAVVLTGVWALSGAHFFWPAIPLGILAIGFLKHARYRRWAAAHVPAPWNRPADGWPEGGGPGGQAHRGHGHGGGWHGGGPWSHGRRWRG